jgi:hypothetical protein
MRRSVLRKNDMSRLSVMANKVPTRVRRGRSPTGKPEPRIESRNERLKTECIMSTEYDSTSNGSAEFLSFTFGSDDIEIVFL